jgi:diguanylate cyclase (GGDEF)-like protein
MPALKPRIYAGFGAALMVVAIIGGVSYRATQHLITSTAALRRSTEVQAEVTAVLSAITDGEEAEEDFVLYGEEHCLGPYYQSIPEAQHHLQNLQILTQNEGEQRARLEVLAQAVNQHARDMAETVEQRRNHGEAEARKRLAAHEADIETVRQLTADMEAEQSRTVQQWTNASHASARRALFTVVTLSMLAFGLVSLACYAVLVDLQMRRRVEESLRQAREQLRQKLGEERELARLDSLTGLANRRAFFELAERARAWANRYHRPLAVVYLDVDNFKQVNDTLGHVVGDTVLIRVAEVLRKNLRAQDAVARLGGDEFAILLPETGAQAVEKVLHKLHNVLHEEMDAQGFKVSFSMGGAAFLDPQLTLQDMIRIADDVMYGVKERGKDDVSVVVMG